jgi:DNA repair protein RadD
MKLRGYQQKVINYLWDYYRDNDGNPVIAMPTGTGKSLIIAEILKTLDKNKKRAVVLTHVKELISQNYNCYIRYHKQCREPGIYSAGIGCKKIRPITFAGIGSVYKLAKNFGTVACVIIDECHLVSPKAETMYGAFLNELREINSNVKVIGLSATPFRTKEGYLHNGPIFTDLAVDLTTTYWFKQLIQDNYLAQLTTKQTDTEYDVSKVLVRGGEFVPKDLQATVDKRTLTEQIIKEVITQGDNRKHWLVFASGIEHANNICTCLKDNGITCASLDSKMTSQDRDRIIRQYKKGKLKALVNVNILTTGFDFPGIDLIVVLRPTLSPVLWVQMLGRGTRPAKDKTDCLVLDFAGNIKRLGPIDNVYLPFLKKKKGNLATHKAPVKVCPKCKVFCHARVTKCPTCGFIFPKDNKLHTKASDLSVMGGDYFNAEITRKLFRVDRVLYKKHVSKKGLNTLLITYKCGKQFITSYVCFEHKGFARTMAKRWFFKHGGDVNNVPITVDEVLVYIARKQLRSPKYIIVKTGKRYKEIVDWRFE